MKTYRAVEHKDLTSCQLWQWSTMRKWEVDNVQTWCANMTSTSSKLSMSVTSMLWVCLSSFMARWPCQDVSQTRSQSWGSECIITNVCLCLLSLAVNWCYCLLVSEHFIDFNGWVSICLWVMKMNIAYLLLHRDLLERWGPSMKELYLQNQFTSSYIREALKNIFNLLLATSKKYLLPKTNALFYHPHDKKAWL